MATATKEMVVKASKRNSMVAMAEETPVKSTRKLVTATSVYNFEDDLTVTGQAEVPEEIQEQADAWLEDYKAFLIDRTESYVHKVAALQASAKRGVGPEAGEPTVGNYPYWDLVTFSPIQFIGAPPFAPHKIIASGEFAVVWALLFINPAPAPGGNPSATTALGARPFRLRFEQSNITDMTNGPDVTFVGAFPSPAPALTFFPMFFVAPDPGVNPRLIEVNVTIDITTAAQPFAAFATHHLDIDSEPGFLGIPTVNPELQHDIPLRYMIYRK